MHEKRLIHTNEFSVHSSYWLDAVRNGITFQYISTKKRLPLSISDVCRGEWREYAIIALMVFLCRCVYAVNFNENFFFSSDLMLHPAISDMRLNSVVHFVAAAASAWSGFTVAKRLLICIESENSAGFSIYRCFGHSNGNALCNGNFIKRNDQTECNQ